MIAKIDISTYNEIKSIYESLLAKSPDCSFNRKCFKNIYMNKIIEILVNDTFLVRFNIDIDNVDRNLDEVVKESL